MKNNRIVEWFTNLSRIGRYSVVTALILGGLMTAGAVSGPADEPTIPTSAPAKAETQHTPTIETKEITETEQIPYATETRDDGSLAKGTTKVAQQGVAGERTRTIAVTYTDGVETSRETVNETVTKEPIAHIISHGTYVAPPAPAPKPAAKSSCDPNYSGCVPNVSYDLDCPDIGFMVAVYSYDKHRFDRDGDGYGCETYG